MPDNLDVFEVDLSGPWCLFVLKLWWFEFKFIVLLLIPFVIGLVVPVIVLGVICMAIFPGLREKPEAIKAEAGQAEEAPEAVLPV